MNPELKIIKKKMRFYQNKKVTVKINQVHNGQEKKIDKQLNQIHKKANNKS